MSKLSGKKYELYPALRLVCKLQSLYFVTGLVFSKQLCTLESVNKTTDLPFLRGYQ